MLLRLHEHLGRLKANLIGVVANPVQRHQTEYPYLGYGGYEDRSMSPVGSDDHPAEWSSDDHPAEWTSDVHPAQQGVYPMSGGVDGEG